MYIWRSEQCRQHNSVSHSTRRRARAYRHHAQKLCTRPLVGRLTTCPRRYVPLRKQQSTAFTTCQAASSAHPFQNTLTYFDPFPVNHVRGPPTRAHQTTAPASGTTAIFAAATAQGFGARRAWLTTSNNLRRCLCYAHQHARHSSLDCQTNQ